MDHGCKHDLKSMDGLFSRRQHPGVYQPSAAVACGTRETPHSPVLRPHVGALPVLGGRVVHLEENLKQVGWRHLRRVVLELNDLGVTGVARADLRGGKVRRERVLHEDTNE